MEQILTFKQKHNKDFSKELEKARAIANFVRIHTNRTLIKGDITTKHVKHFGLKACIANQIIRRNIRGKTKKIKKNKFAIGDNYDKSLSPDSHLYIPNQALKVYNDGDFTQIYIPCLKYKIYIPQVNYLNQIKEVEIDANHVYIKYSRFIEETFKPKGVIGVDVNLAPHLAVAVTSDRQVLKLGKGAKHLIVKYGRVIRKLENKKCYKAAKRARDRRKNKLKDANHKVANWLAKFARKNKLIIALEALPRIKGKKYGLFNWPLYQLQKFIEYKARIQGVLAVYVDPRNSSKECSECGLLTPPSFKTLHCLCGHVQHSDINAAFNVLGRAESTLLSGESFIKSNTGVTKFEDFIAKSTADITPPSFFLKYC